MITARNGGEIIYYVALLTHLSHCGDMLSVRFVDGDFVEQGEVLHLKTVHFSTVHKNKYRVCRWKFPWSRLPAQNLDVTLVTWIFSRHTNITGRTVVKSANNVNEEIQRCRATFGASAASFRLGKFHQFIHSTTELQSSTSRAIQQQSLVQYDNNADCLKYPYYNTRFVRSLPLNHKRAQLRERSTLSLPCLPWFSHTGTIRPNRRRVLLLNKMRTHAVCVMRYIAYIADKG